MPVPRLVAFDLDDTLAPSKSPLDPRMLDTFARLLDAVPVAVISGGQFAQFDQQLVAPLRAREGLRLDDLHLMPTCGTRYYRWLDADWHLEYAEDLTEDERTRAIAAVEDQAKQAGLWETETWGPIIEDRGSQITFSALGQAAPVDAKKAWDPDGSKKDHLKRLVQAQLPDLEVRSGGSTSIDITRKGIDKAYGMTKLAHITGIALDDMLFVGDRLDPEGNDYPVKALGVPCHAVTGWPDTADYLDELIPRFRAPVV
ncbi:HAD-IIB family hydrolase [Curtobacterium sp. MCBD17_003]|uniref:HAD-IIB family hydrolase n=1 Tax=Curtobacterium sp. MCBD17_003 TaxID=2175667 RepID=UPI000DA8E37B|nr:HAD-IIB family hydrolase [Curtobacterium sp. MCBD17_003]WIE55130.1 HAD-IIB family hydrolase [Curtobacterium sp. MCBD17_003]